MPVPKKKYSKSKMGMRRSHDALHPVKLGRCAQCGSPRQPHRVCRECGFYNGRKILSVVKEEEA
jgi:large subunit ribosomal protein L32